MSEQPNQPARPADGVPAPDDREERDVRHAGGGRTAGETSVDEALGQGGPPAG